MLPEYWESPKVSSSGPFTKTCDVTRSDRTATTARGPLMTTEQVAGYLGVPRSTLYAWKYRGNGPPAIRVGRYLRYRSVDVEHWLDKRTDKGTS